MEYDNASDAMGRPPMHDGAARMIAGHVAVARLVLEELKIVEIAAPFWGGAMIFTFPQL
jgi:hypothetical protein